MITLCELIKSTTWTKPQDHMRVSLWDRSKVYEDGEFTDIELNVKSLAMFGDYYVSDIDIEVYGENEPVLACMIWKD